MIHYMQGWNDFIAYETIEEPNIASLKKFGLQGNKKCITILMQENL